MSDINLLQPVSVVIVGLVAQSVVLASVLKVSIAYIEKNMARLEAEAARAHARIDKLLENPPWQAKAEPQAVDLKKVHWLQR